MSKYQISKKRLAEIIKEEYESILSEEKPVTNEKLTLDQIEIDEEEMSASTKRPKASSSDTLKKESVLSIRRLIQQELKNL